MHAVGSHVRILVVEDEPELREALMQVLRTRGYDAVGAAGGQEALDRMRGPKPPALVLLDLMLPGMDGFEFRLRQSEDPDLAGVPVVIVSAGVDLQRKAAALAPDACLSKPVDPGQLLDVVGRLCAETRLTLRAGRRSRGGRAARGAGARRQDRRDHHTQR